jgi:hypothetical protein
MLFKETIAVYSENHTKLLIQNAALLIVKTAGTQLPLGIKGLRKKSSRNQSTNKTINIYLVAPCPCNVA